MTAASIAEQIGEQMETIRKKNVDWAAEIVKKGVILDLHIGRARFMRKMTKADLGLDDMDDKEFDLFMSDYYMLGQKLLAPKRIMSGFERIESRGRAIQYKYTFQTPWGYFCPFTAYNQLKEELTEQRDAYYAEKVKFKESLVSLREEIIKEYQKAAVKIYEHTKKTKSIEQFTDDFLKNINTQLPTEEVIESSFYFSWEISYIPLPSEIEEEFLKAEILRRETTIEHAKTQAEMEKIKAELQMHNDTLKYISDTKKQKVDSLLDSISQKLGGAIFTGVTDVLESIKKSASLSSKKIKKMQELVKKTRMMNFLEDQNVEDALQRIEDVLSSHLMKGTLKNTTEIFNDIANEFRTCALETKSDVPDIKGLGFLL